MNKKGSLADPVIFMVMALIVVLTMGIFIYIWSQVDSTLSSVNIPTNSLGLNISDASDKTIGVMNAGVPMLRTVGVFMIIGMVLTILLTNFLIKVHPAMFIVYVMFGMGAIMTSAYVSNIYVDNILTMPELGSIYAADVGGSTFLIYLPHIMTVVVFFGLILLLAGIVRDEGAGGGVI